VCSDDLGGVPVGHLTERAALAERVWLSCGPLGDEGLHVLDFAEDSLVELSEREDLRPGQWAHLEQVHRPAFVHGELDVERVRARDLLELAGELQDPPDVRIHALESGAPDDSRY